MSSIEILGTGFVKAQKKVTNFDLEKRVETSDEWIVQRTGISSRYVSETENTSDLAYKASLQAIEDAHIQKEDIEVIIVATMTPDCMTPSTACLVQAKLGLNDCPVFAFDINGACSGFLYAFQIASDLLSRYHHILVIGSETISKMIDWNDRSTCVLFGDGAGAMVLGRGDTKLYHYANSEGDLQEVLHAQGLPLVHDLQNQGASTHYLNMKGNDVFRFAVRVLKESIENVLKQIIFDTLSDGAKDETKNFLTKSIMDASYNPSPGQIYKLLERINTDWKQQFESFIHGSNQKGELKSLVELRNSFAHGSSITASIRDVVNYFDAGVWILEKLCDVVEKAE